MNPDAAGLGFSSGKNPCFSLDPRCTGVVFHPNRAVSYLVSYAHLLNAEWRPESNVVKDPEICPDRITLRFATMEIVVVGSGLARVMAWLQRAELASVKAVEPRLAVPGQPYVQSIRVTLAQPLQ